MRVLHVFVQVLPGWVKSIEDHGYIIEFGVEGKTGFLLKKNASEFIKTRNRKKPLCLGQVLQCLVLLGSDSRTTSLSLNPSAVASSLMPGDSLISLPSLLPGMLVNTTVKEVGCMYQYMCIKLPSFRTDYMYLTFVDSEVVVIVSHHADA